MILIEIDFEYVTGIITYDNSDESYSTVPSFGAVHYSLQVYGFQVFFHDEILNDLQL